MKANFNIAQTKLLKKIGLNPTFDSSMSEDDVEAFVNIVSDYLQDHGFSDTELNSDGKICEEILNLIADI